MNLFLLESAPGVPKGSSGKGTKIVLNRQSDLILDGARITKPVGIVLNDVEGVTNAIDNAFFSAEMALEKEAGARKEGDDALQSALEKEAAVRKEADGELQSALDKESAVRKAADSELESALAKEIARAQCAEDALEFNLEKESISRQEADDVLAVDLKSETEARIKSGKELFSSLEKEAEVRKQGDADLQKQIDFITSNVDPDSIDSLTEVVAAFQSADDDLNGAISDLAAAASKGLKSETERAMASEDKIATNLENAISDFKKSISEEAEKRATYDKDEAESRIKADSELNAALTEEIFARLCAEEGINNELATTRKDLDSYITKVSKELSGSIEKESYIRAAADKDLYAAIEEEHSHHVAAEAKLTADLSIETSRAELVEAELSVSLSIEASNRIAISAIHLARAISAEDSIISLIESDIKDITKDLTSKIDNVISNTDPDALDSLSEIVSAFQSADNDLNGAIKSLADSASKNLEKEAAVRKEADSELQSALEKEAAVRKSADGELQSALEKEIARAQCAEESLEVALSAEVSYLISNTDLNAIDSFSEVVADVENLNYQFMNVYSMRQSFKGEVNGVNNEFVLQYPLRGSSDAVYLNGLLLAPFADYTVHGTSVIFGVAPSFGDKVTIYGIIDFGKEGKPMS